MTSVLKQIICKTNSLKSIQLQWKRSINDWHLISGVCLQRLPQIVPEMNWLEKKMSEVLFTVETNRSLYCDHEMRHFEDLRRAKRIASGEKVDEKDLDAAAKQTAQDFEEFYNELYNKFEKSPRITQSDVTNDKKSLNRCLDKHLMLICRQQLNGEHKWLLPQAVNIGDETMRQTAERALKQFNNSGQQIDVRFLGNAPSTVYSYRYPEKVAEESQVKGAKIFFFKAQLLNGEFTQNKDFCDDYQWLNRKELSTILPQRYWKTIEKSLYMEELDINDIMTKNKTFRNIVKKKFSVSQNIK